MYSRNFVRQNHGAPTEPAAPASHARRANSHRCRDLVWTLLLAALLSPAVRPAQDPGGRGTNQEAGAEPARRGDEDAEQQRRLPGGIFRRLRELSPIEQRRIMANNPQFLRLPLARQQLIRERLRQWNAMTPQQRERIREREEILEGLSPQQREEARNIFPQWRDLTPGRRQAVMVAFRHLRDLPPDERHPFLESQQVREQFSPHEREILDGLNKLLPTSKPRAPDGPEE